jgi:hypothetical protein
MMAWCVGAVFMAAAFCFFAGFVRWAALVFLRSFFTLYFFGCFPVEHGKRILNSLLYFCLLLLMKNNCSPPAVTADLRPPLRPWLAG